MEWNRSWCGEVRLGYGMEEDLHYSASQLYITPNGGAKGNHRSYEQNMAGLLPKGERKLLGSWVKMQRNGQSGVEAWDWA